MTAPTIRPVRYDGTPPGTVTTTTAGVTLPLHHRVRHSPTGFGWGYGGSGPADLALSLLWDALGAEPHPALYQEFKRRIVALWPADRPWHCDRDLVRDWVLAAAQHDDSLAVVATGRTVEDTDT